MINKHSISEPDAKTFELIDEGWWNAVLSDEELSHQEKKEYLEKDPNGSIFHIDWEKSQRLFENDDVVDLKVIGYNRGGLLVRGEGLQGFVPISHLVKMDNERNPRIRLEKLASYAEQILHLKIIECDASKERIVFSERAALAGCGKRKQIYASLVKGNNVKGIITNITEFGVFVDIGGVEGLIHVSELSWGRVKYPKEVCKIGDCIEAMVLSINEESSRVALSYKRLFPNPWETMMKEYKPGDIIQATITELTKFGAFAKLCEGVEGLIHSSAMNNNSEEKDVGILLKPGKRVLVQILHIDIAHRRLGLGLVKME